MASPFNGRQRLRFGLFEADLATRELHKHGRLIHIQEKPFRILAMLLERPGEIVSREEVQKKLWPDGTFVDFDESLDTALKSFGRRLGTRRKTQFLWRPSRAGDTASSRRCKARGMGAVRTHVSLFCLQSTTTTERRRKRAWLNRRWPALGCVEKSC